MLYMKYGWNEIIFFFVNDAITVIQFITAAIIIININIDIAVNLAMSLKKYKHW